MSKGNISIHAIIFCCGWETKSLHTIFSYIFTSLSNYTRYGKTLAHWFFMVSNDIYGGASPTLDNTKTEPEKVIFFVDDLFSLKDIVHTQHEFEADS